MPIYVYQCGCGYREVVEHSIHADVEIICTYCDKPLVRKPQVMSVEFIGTGWASRETR